MAIRKSSTSPNLTAVAFVVSCVALSMPAASNEQPAPQAERDSLMVSPTALLVQHQVIPLAEPQAAPQAGSQDYPECTADLTRPGTMSGIVSNALCLGLKMPREDVSSFLEGAHEEYASVAELVKAAAARFKISEDVLAAKIEKYKHCNCKHPMPNPLHPHLHVDPHAHPGCKSNIMNAGTMADVLANALYKGLGVSEEDASDFLGDSEKFEDSQDVFKRTAVQFNIGEDVLAAAVQTYRHCNCKGILAGGAAATPDVDDGIPVTAFARNVTLHVVLHELGHALIREFDIPILGNEETMAEVFATYYLTTYLPDRAVDVLSARVTSLMIEAGETPEVDWTGEHDDDARRAYQIAAIAVAADREKYKPVADIVGMSQKDIKRAVDYGAEIRRSWRRVLAPLMMPEGAVSKEAGVDYEEDNGFLDRLFADGLARELESAARRFDWHSKVTIRFVNGDGGAGWSRDGRTITVHTSYVRRFIHQGARGLHVAQSQTGTGLQEASLAPSPGALGGR